MLILFIIGNRLKDCESISRVTMSFHEATHHNIVGFIASLGSAPDNRPPSLPKRIQVLHFALTAVRRVRCFTLRVVRLPGSTACFPNQQSRFVLL